MRTKLVKTLKKTVDKQLCALGVCSEPQPVLIEISLLTKDELWTELNKKFDEIDASKTRK